MDWAGRTHNLGIVICPEAWAQKGETKGRIMDAQTKTPLSFASVRIFKSSSQTPELVDGGVANEEGYFKVNTPVGSYHALIEFMGYSTFKTSVFSITKDKINHDLGIIQFTTVSSFRFTYAALRRQNWHCKLSN
jgi:hypothetical protein